MKGLIAGLLLSGAAVQAMPTQPAAQSQTMRAPLSASLPVAREWQFRGESNTACEFEREGELTAVDGAELAFGCYAGTVMGQLDSGIDATAWRHKRVTFSIEFKHSAALNASAWIKVRNGATVLFADDDTEQQFTDATVDDGWVQRTLTAVVPIDATDISVGLRVQGSGDLQVRAARLMASQPLATAAPVSAWLDTVIALVKRHVPETAGLRWSVLEPQVRLFAAGAQTTADAYPVVRYLLMQTGQRQAMLLEPALASWLGGSPRSVEAGVQMFALSDGARLILPRNEVLLSGVLRRR